MKKKRIFCAILVIAMLVGSMSVYAYSYSAEAKKRGMTYNIHKTGSNSTFYAVGTKTKLYTNAVNNSNTSIYMKASVQRYDHSTKKYTRKQYEGVIGQGYMVNSGEMSREYQSDVLDYYYGCETYYSTYNSSAMRADTYSYTAFQYYK